MLPDNETERCDLLDNADEEQDVRHDISAVNALTAGGAIPTLVFGGILYSVLDLPSWIPVVVFGTMILAVKLYAVRRFDVSSLPLRIGNAVITGGKRRGWLIIAAIVITAQILAKLMRPYFTG